MARPKKDGLDYFPLDVNMDQDDKVLIIISKYGFEGFGILVKLLMEIYKNGYYYDWTEKEQIIFSSRVSVDINSVKEIVDECIKWGLFNKGLYDEQQVLTSKGIQERYLLATSRRVNSDIIEELRLVSVDTNSNSTDKQPAKSTQSKVKEKKVKETIKKEAYASHVRMTTGEYEKLVDQFGEDGAKDRIENLNLYKGSKGKKYKDDYLTILAWERKNKKNAPKIKPKQSFDEYQKNDSVESSVNGSLFD